MDDKLKQLIIMQKDIIIFIQDWIPSEAVKGYKKKAELMDKVDKWNNYIDDNFTDKELLVLFKEII